VEYVLLRERDQPTHLTSLVATADPVQAAGLVRAWRRAHPEEGLIATVGERTVVHCRPHASGR